MISAVNGLELIQSLLQRQLVLDDGGHGDRVDDRELQPSGSGDMAQSIAALRGGAPDTAFSGFVGQLGNAVASAMSSAATASSVLSAIDNQRQSVSGVSMDEEMTNLITYQRGYQASAKMMSTINACMDTLINNTI